ncbi:RNA dependent RNA polymerase-domain-containing protein [Ilyonectria sp. MPI-CAGE-AT-0026]|nr:RNA dependent RNA polymerase-domain-containing protein [Ilyonectria sp. MPI-CAGE-AT-0026]
MSAHELKGALSEWHLRLEYDFSVMMEISSQEVSWYSFYPSTKGRKIAARVIVPNKYDYYNPATKLIGREISIRFHRKQVTLSVQEIRDPETPNHMYVELRKRKLLSEHTWGLRDGPIGYVHKVSCGTFNDRKFETAHVWSYDEKSSFKRLSYFGDVKPPKFRVCLPEEKRRGSLKREWMDFHESNVRGLIFERPEGQTRGLRKSGVIYFVVDKPPQFYRRSEGLRPCQSISNALDPETPSRIPHPSSLQVHADDELDVCGVPWVIQYSRVFKVEYRKARLFTMVGVQFRLEERERKRSFICCEHPAIKESGRSISDIASTIKSNIQKVSTLFPPYLIGCQLAVIKLLYNCNISATSPETLSDLRQSDIQDIRHSRKFSELLHKRSEDMGTSHVRELQGFFKSSSDTPDYRYFQLPGTSVDNNVTNSPRISSSDLAIESTEWHEGLSPGIFEILVYPSHIEMQGPLDSPNNSITDQYRHLIGRFLRIKFVDNNSKPLKVETKVDLAEILEHRVFGVLANRTKLFSPLLRDLIGFEFLGYSMSSLKKKKAVWFFQRQDGLDAKAIRDQIGDWDVARKANSQLAKYPSKWGARVSLAFTESIPVLSLSSTDWSVRADTGNPKLSPTDGCGLISLELCESINEKLDPYGFASSRAFQIRFGGVKGVVYAGAKSLLEGEGEPRKMLLRNSQRKFRVPDERKLDLRIVSTAGDGHQSLFFASAIKALEDSGACPKEIKNIYQKAYADLSTANPGGLDLLRQILGIQSNLKDDGTKGRHCLLKLAIRLNEKGIHPQDYSKSFLRHYLARLAAKARDKDLFKIPIPGSFSLLGITDDYKVLNPNEVLIRAQGKTIGGPVLIYRDPVIHIGDIQQAQAVSEAELKARLANAGSADGQERIDALLGMHNVIFFSQKDVPPFPSRLSGGDLDGDRFEILTKCCGFWDDKYKTTEPNSYIEDEGTSPADQETSPPKSVRTMNPFDIEELARFIAQYIQNDCFAQLEHRLLALAESKARGMNDPDVKDLAKWLSKAVDYAKSGERVNLASDVFSKVEFRVQENPDFLRALGGNAVIDSSAGYYKSPNLLGTLYRTFKSIEYHSPDESEMKNEDIIARLAEVWKTEEQEHNNPTPDLLQFFKEVDTQLGHYKEKFWRGSSPEVNLFIRKQHSDFPNDMIQNIVRMVSSALDRSNMAEWSGKGPSRVRPREPHGLDAVKAMYEQYLYSAWYSIPL